MILPMRIITDMLWEYKVVGIFLNFLMFLATVFTAFKYKIYLDKETKNILIVLFFILCFFTYSFLSDASSYIIYGKILGSLFIFLYGFIYKGKISKVLYALEIFSIMLVVSFFLYSFLPNGYIYWGSVKTFVGPYFFKTDMALSIAICLIFILNSKSLGKKIKILLAILSFYIIFITNARIHLLTGFSIIFLYFYKDFLFKNFKRNLIYGIIFSILLFSFLLFVFQDFMSSKGMLIVSMNSEEFLSGGNLQGRNVIWLGLLDGYLNSSLLQKIFGASLTADSRYVAAFTDDTISHNAHNTYFFMVIAIGLLGFFFFVKFIYMIFRKLSLEISKSKNGSIIYITLCNIVLFLVSGLSNITIIFQQQTWFFMFFSGYLFNRTFAYRKEQLKIIKNLELPKE